MVSNYGRNIFVAVALGYGGLVGALKAMGAIEMGINEEELPELVSAWRNSNPNIVRFWWDVDRAVKKAIQEKTSTATHVFFPNGRNSKDRSKADSGG